MHNSIRFFNVYKRKKRGKREKIKKKIVRKNVRKNSEKLLTKNKNKYKICSMKRTMIRKT